MKRKIVGMFVCTLLIATVLPITEPVMAGDEENPEIKDRIMDVMVFKFFRAFPQLFFKHIDIVSVWFYEDAANPDYIYVSLKLRDLEENTDSLEAIYGVEWNYFQDHYLAIIKIHSGGIYGGFYVDKVLGHDQFECHECIGTVDVENNIITWGIQKEFIGDPIMGHVLEDTSAYTTLRHFNETTRTPGPDLFNDFTVQLIGNQGYGNNYRIKY